MQVCYARDKNIFKYLIKNIYKIYLKCKFVLENDCPAHTYLLSSSLHEVYFHHCNAAYTPEYAT